MKFNVSFLVFSLLICVQLSYAQIGNEIKSYVDSTELFVNNGRKLILQKVNMGDISKTNEIYQYLNKITYNSNYKAFSYTEELYINVLLKDWNNLLVLFKNYETGIKKYTYPNSYPIWTVLYDKIVEHSDTLKTNLYLSSLNDEDKAVLDIYLYLLKVRNIDNDYNLKLKAFMKTYKPSLYDKFIKEYLPGYKVDGAIAWSIGSGAIMPTGKINTDFSTNASINMSMDINIGKVFTSLYLNGCNFGLKSAFSTYLNDDTVRFNQNDRFHYFNAGLKCGYFIVRKDKFQLTPYISISGISLESTLYDDEKDGDEYEFFNSFCYGFGFHSEVKLFEFNLSNYYGSPANSYISLKLESGYNIIAKHNANYKGNAPDITLALVWGIGSF